MPATRISTISRILNVSVPRATSPVQLAAGVKAHKTARNSQKPTAALSAIRGAALVPTLETAAIYSALEAAPDLNKTIAWLAATSTMMVNVSKNVLRCKSTIR